MTVGGGVNDDFEWYFDRFGGDFSGIPSGANQEMFLGLTPAGGEDAARTAGQEAGVTSR
jgi:hypothetical protein